jgi:hypothetical protein
MTSYSYRSQLGKPCSQDHGRDSKVETYSADAGRIRNWPAPRLNASAAAIREQQSSFCTESVSIRHDEQFPAQRKR